MEQPVSRSTAARIPPNLIAGSLTHVAAGTAEVARGLLGSTL
jgi:hypothetical protein